MTKKIKQNKQIPRETVSSWEEALILESEQRREDEKFMREALSEARMAADAWEVPIGAVLVQNGRIIARAHNLVEETRDATAHAEMLCIRYASNQLRTWRLAESTLYVTLEPCAMCAGAILQSRIGTVVWGAPNKLLGADGSWVRLFPNQDKEKFHGTSEEPPTSGPVHPFHPYIKIRRGINAMTTWPQMKEKFLIKYQDYCRTSSIGGDKLFRLAQKEDEPLENYLEIFLFNVHNSKQTRLPNEPLKLLFLKGLSEEDMDALDLIGAGDISKSTFEEICESCKNYSRATMKRIRSARSKGGSTTKKIGEISKLEILNIFNNMKHEIVNEMATQLDTLHANKKRENEEENLTEFYHACRRKKADCKCRGLVIEEREASPEFKMKETEDGQVFYVAQRKPWMPRQGSMS
ncbi:hypothetical protein KI387_028325 [Taxus chinensis]|uniref:CMP/dCMP-type deaminase domain-containing protein n=1 Tax=Taxus chinensis TaxID=29808 RepID=A0AA38G0H5_TAXCH|nr:hypothetical protein KI387_028325 [Taxus chinensis]